MKTTLTQAWEARGVHGMLLRSRVRGLLIERFYEDKSKRALAKDAMIALAFMAVTGPVAYLILDFLFRYAIPVVDASRTLEFLLVLGMGLGAGVLLGVFVYTFGAMVKDLVALGYIDRYIFEHRDDEVEL
ncbi:hypothetical protein HY493_00015 [Candidatus Woesearchaeota archaeon]|nr:hypothetical protein [Candidatus Woesearchaeota archaeon]